MTGYCTCANCRFYAKHKTQLIASAIETMRDIAAMGKKAGSETAKHWLFSNNLPLEEGGYVPGKGFIDGTDG